MPETEVFSLTPEVGRCYEYAEATRQVGRYPNTKYFTTNPLRYVGQYVRRNVCMGGYQTPDGGCESIFQDNNGREQSVYHSYDGKTCFREVPCSLQSLSGYVVKNQVDYSRLPPAQKRVIDNSLSKAWWGGSKRHRRIKTPKRRKTKRRKTKRKNIK